jgi:hypothetical protein
VLRPGQGLTCPLCSGGTAPHRFRYVDRDQIYVTVGETVRVLCLLRLARLARLVNMDCRFWVRRPKKGAVAPAPQPAATEGGEGEKPADPSLVKERSRMGNQLIEEAVRKVIVVIVFIILIFPLLEPSRIIYSHAVKKFQRQGLDQLHDVASKIYSNATNLPMTQKNIMMKKNVQVRDERRSVHM